MTRGVEDTAQKGEVGPEGAEVCWVKGWEREFGGSIQGCRDLQDPGKEADTTVSCREGSSQLYLLAIQDSGSECPVAPGEARLGL